MCIGIASCADGVSKDHGKAQKRIATLELKRISRFLQQRPKLLHYGVAIMQVGGYSQLHVAKHSTYQLGSLEKKSY